MTTFFAGLYHWWGMNPFYSRALHNQLRGWDVTCSGFFGRPWYNYAGLTMTAVTVFIYALQYHIVDSSRFNKKSDLWIMTLVTVLLNFFVAFAISYNNLRTSNYCISDVITIGDCIGFGFTNAFWSVILLFFLTSVNLFRQLSTNCRHTTFWKP